MARFSYVLMSGGHRSARELNLCIISIREFIYAPPVPCPDTPAQVAKPSHSGSSQQEKSDEI